MSTSVLNLPVGTPIAFPVGTLAYSLCAQPGAAGKVLIEYSADNGRTYYPAPAGLRGTPYSINMQTAIGGIGGEGLAQVGSNANPGAVVRATAYTAPGRLICSDLSLPSPYGAEKSILVQSGVAYACQNQATEQTLWSMRFQPGFFRQDFSSWALELELWATIDGSASRTLSVHFGPTAFDPATGLEGGTLVQAVALDTFIGYAGRFGVSGRNDGQTVVTQCIGGADLGGYGATTNAQVIIVGADYLKQEQVLSITATAALENGTIAGAVTLDRVAVRYVQ